MGLLLLIFSYKNHLFLGLPFCKPALILLKYAHQYHKKNRKPHRCATHRSDTLLTSKGHWLKSTPGQMGNQMMASPQSVALSGFVATSEVKY